MIIEYYNIFDANDLTFSWFISVQV